MKDHESFLRAAARVAALRPEARFLCIGEGSEGYRQALVRLAAGLGIADRVIWTGRCTDPAAALAGLDICCSSSSFGEGFSNAIGEAMACGLPCVVTDVGDSALLVGATGTVVPRRQPEALAEALLAEVGRLGEGRGGRARARIVENFSVDRMVERTLSLVLPDKQSCGTDRSE
jgi:glycosyltransferase involved in cell wall biosynthesis